MKRKTMKRSISTLLTLAMLLGLLPGTAFAALPEEAQDVIEFKVMQLENLSSGDFVSLYKYKNGLNTFHAPINMNEGTQGGFSLTRLSFAISMSQPISLEVYEMADDYPIAPPGGKDGHSSVVLNYDPEGGTEPFLGQFKGYIYGTRRKEEHNNKKKSKKHKTE